MHRIQRLNSIKCIFLPKRLVLIVFILLLPTIALADVQSVVRQCESCHGKNGYSSEPDVPIIAGFSYYGFFDTLEAFRLNERLAMEFHVPGEPEAVMNEIANNLNEDEVKALARHFSSQTFKPAMQMVYPTLAKRGAELHEKYCEKCHADGGSDPQDDAAILAGQWMKYLSRQFENIDTGKRIVPRKMKQRIDKLSAEDKKALLNFYGSDNCQR